MFYSKALPGRILCVLIVWLAIGNSKAFGQLTANFTGDKSGGCSPLTVAFTNTTTGASATATYQWDLGNGNTSTLKNPGATYREEKTYTVTLTVKDGAATSVKTLQLTVYKTPTVAFSPSITKGCAPLNVTFNTNATPGDGSIDSYFWDFGDGGTTSTTAAQQSHTYNFAQTASVSLTVKNSYGCYSTLQKPSLVEVVPGITISFAADKTVLCKTGDAVSFTNNSTGPADVTWLWDFGDGTTSTVKAPSHTYTTKGVYAVKLTASSAAGCTNSETKAAYINVANFTTDFTVPALICQNTNVSFVSNSSPSPNNASWYINDQLYYYNNGSIPYTFYTEGSFKIKLVNTFGTCQDETTKTITVKAAPKLNGFVVETNGVCGAPVNIQLKDTSAAAVKWAWSYYYSSSTFSTVKEPVLPVTTDGQFEVRLTITDAVGCTNTTSKYLMVAKPNVSVDVLSSSNSNYWIACEGLTAKFGATSNDEIVDYKWSFGDGGTSTQAQPTHSFTKAGNYYVRVDYITKAGCKGTATLSGGVQISQQPKVDFTAPGGTTICGNTPTTFSATNLAGTPVTSYLWMIDNHAVFNNNTSTYTHQFDHDTTFTVSVIARNGGCADTVVKKDYVKVLPPFPKIGQVTNTCDGTRGLVTINDLSTKATKWSWNFGDGSAALTYTNAATSVQHLYTKTGKFKVVLTATNGSCDVKDSLPAYVYLKQKPMVTATQTEICASNNLNLTLNNFEALNFLDYYYYYQYSVRKIEYGDGTSFNGYYSYYPFSTAPVTGYLQGLQAGKKDMRFILQTGYFGCYDTSNYVPMVFKGPAAGYSIANNNGCFKTPLIFQDTSKTTNNVAITKWEWSFGNGSVQTATNNNPVTYRYSSPGSYYTQLKVTDADGCSSTANNYQYASVTGPSADFSYSPTSVQPGATVNFYNNTNNYNSYSTIYQWMFKDRTTYSTFNATRFYPNVGTDTVKLIAKNPQSTCVDTAIKVITIKNVSASFTYTSSYINNNSCPPVIVRFTNTSVNVSRVAWDFGDGSKTDNQNFPSHTYYKPGVYMVTLYATSSTGLTDSIVDSVVVKGPYAVLKADRLTACGAQEFTFSADVHNATSFTWDFADGNLQDTKDTFAVHTYIEPGVYTPSLILKDGGGCSATSDMPDKIVIDTLSVGFSKNPPQVCDSAYVQFSPVIKSLAADQMQQTLQYHWSFGTGNVADTANSGSPVFNFNKPGKYAVSLTASSPYGCVKQTIDTLVVIQKAKAAITGPAEICQQTTALFTGSANASGITTWAWAFGNGGVSAVQNPSAQLYNANGTVNVQLVISKSGCNDTAVTQLVVHPKPAINLQPKNPVVCLGKSVQLVAGDGITYKWDAVAGLSNYNIANPFAQPLKTSQFIVEATNQFGCKSKDTSIVKVAEPFKLKVPADTFVCRGNSVQLYATGADTYKWISNTASLSNSAIANPVAVPLSATTYSVVGYDAYQCFTDTAIIRIGVQQYPTVSAGPDMEVQTGTDVQLTATGSSDVVSWLWSPADYLSCTNCSSPVSKPRSQMSYVVKATNKYGCAVSDTLNIKLVCAQGKVYIPSAFTPNKDFKNDMFYIKGSGVKQVNFFRIYNRAGQIIFEKSNFQLNDPSSGWDGMSRGYEMPAGAYVYFAELVCDTGEVFPLKGTVVLVR